MTEPHYNFSNIFGHTNEKISVAPGYMYTVYTIESCLFSLVNIAISLVNIAISLVNIAISLLNMSMYISSTSISQDVLTERYKTQYLLCVCCKKTLLDNGIKSKDFFEQTHNRYSVL